MHHRLAKVMLGIAAVALPAHTWAQNSPAPQTAAPGGAAPAAGAAQAAGGSQESPYKDPEEYNIANAASTEKDPQKQLDKLKEWEQKYPDSKLKGTRTLVQAQALLKIATAAFSKTTGPEVDAGQKAAQQIVDNMDNFFAPGVKPAAATDDQWAAARKQFETQSHMALGWAAMNKRTDDVAEQEFKKVLAIDPTLAQVSYWLGSVIIRQKKVERYPEALYDIARAVSVTGPNALPPAAATPANNFLNNAYSNYHGDQTGLPELKQQAAATALPPADFHIKSVTEIDKEKYANQEEFNKAHPDIGVWRQVRDALKGDGAATYFPTIKGSEVPPPEIKMFKAKVVSVNDKDLVVNVDDPAGDATLRFEKALNAKVIEPGTAIQFKGVVDSFTKEPYMLVLTIADPKADVTGLPAAATGAAAPAARRPAARRPATRKK